MCTRLPTAIHWLFGEIGSLKEKHHIVKDREVPPVINPSRSILALLKMTLKEECDKMVKMEIMTLIEEPTDGINGLVIVAKPNGQLRI